VVMAHGFGFTMDSGLLPVAEALAAAGLDVLAFDYRGFGGSSGEPRHLAWPPDQRRDYREAVEFARTLEGVDSERIVLWGTSWSGGHVVYVAASDPRVAAVISQTPDVDGVRTLMRIAEYAGPVQLLRLTSRGLADLIAGVRGRPAITVPAVAPPGEIAGMTTEESEPGGSAIGGPSWRNEVTARAAFAEWTNRAITRMDRVSCPILIQIADRDSVAPPAAARAASWRAKGRVEVREYPCAHFDIYQGEWRERAVADQLHFLRRHLGASRDREAASLTSEA
jgi:pimeloyl-ACP methyl ester carboxylesterase